MRRIVLALAVAFLVPVALEAQKNCKKGIPCGNTCISATKTCRIGTTAPASAAAGQSVAEQAAAPATASGEAAWVASTQGNTYYRNGCSGGEKLSPANRIYFATEES